MVTLRRRLLQLLTRFNVNVHDLGPGAVVLERRGDYRVSGNGERSWSVTRDGDRGTGNSEPGRDRDAVPLGPGATLFVDRDLSPAEEFALHKKAQDHLGARHIASLLRHYRVNCVIDAGANVGQYGKLLRAHGYTGRIVSFEPVAAMVDKLRQACGDDPDWRVYPFALGRQDRTDSINVVHGSMSSLLGPTDFGNTRYKRFRGTRAEEITLRRLDGLLDEALAGIDEPRPYLKLDTQGFDLEAYAGVGERIREFVGMQSEVALLQIYEGMPRMDEAIRTYEADGFEITGMYPVTREEATGRVLEFDCVMARADPPPAGG